jgi:hypothetical protein
MRQTKVTLTLIGLFFSTSILSEEILFSCIDKDGSLYQSEKACPPEYFAKHIGIPHEWKDYCVATFKNDYSYQDSTLGWKVDIKKGDQLLIGTEKKDNSFFPTTFVYFTDQGATVFPCIDESKCLFSSSCDSKNTKSVFAVIDDVTLYADMELEEQACKLTSGKTIDVLATYSFGGWLNTASLSSESLAPVCNGNKKVFYKMKHTNFGYVEPLVRLLAPKSK